MKETTFTIRFRWNMLKKDENKLIIWGGDFFFSCLFFWEKIINTVQSEQFSLTVVSLEVCESAFYCIYLSWEHESLIIRRGNKERNERIRPLFSWLIAFCCGLLRVIILSSVWIHVNFPGDYLAFFFFFFMFCHSISSTFSLFYFHFKGLGGTDVVSNACLLPHCLKVRDDYFLMKLHTLARGEKKEYYL